MFCYPSKPNDHLSYFDQVFQHILFSEGSHRHTRWSGIHFILFSLCFSAYLISYKYQAISFCTCCFTFRLWSSCSRDFSSFELYLCSKVWVDLSWTFFNIFFVIQSLPPDEPVIAVPLLIFQVPHIQRVYLFCWWLVQPSDRTYSSEFSYPWSFFCWKIGLFEPLLIHITFSNLFSRECSFCLWFIYFQWIVLWFWVHWHDLTFPMIPWFCLIFSGLLVSQKCPSDTDLSWFPYLLFNSLFFVCCFSHPRSPHDGLILF